MSESVAALVRMANQISANYRHLPPPEVEAAVATHLRSFWAPSMRDELQAWVDSTGGVGLDADVLAALRHLQPGASNGDGRH